MKCIGYVSKAVVTRRNGAAVPVRLSEIYRVAQKENNKRSVTGVFSYRNGYYIQVIEGEPAAIDQLYLNICVDQRHYNVRMFLDTEIVKRSFSQGMRLLTSVKRDAAFQEFVKRYSSLISELPEETLALFNKFYSIKSGRVEQTVTSYAGKHVSLLAWPDFTLMEQSPAVIDLCARMTAKPQYYDDLMQSNHFSSYQELNGLLNNLDEMGLLRVKQLTEQTERAKKRQNSSGFYDRMKEFLKFG